MPSWRQRLQTKSRSAMQMDRRFRALVVDVHIGDGEIPTRLVRYHALEGQARI